MEPRLFHRLARFAETTSCLLNEYVVVKNVLIKHDIFLFGRLTPRTGHGFCPSSSFACFILKPPFGEMKEANSTSILGWLLCAAVLGPFLAGLAAIGCLEVQWKWEVPVKRENLT